MVFVNIDLGEMLSGSCYNHDRINTVVFGSTQQDFFRRALEVTVIDEPLVEAMIGNFAIEYGRIILEAISNAYMHGNRYNPAKPIDVRAWEQADFYITSITDSGQGFDFETKIANFKKGLEYSDRNSGQGFELFNRDFVLVSYDLGGKRINIMTGRDLVNQDHSVIRSV